jgi:hypothetical protein
LVNFRLGAGRYVGALDFAVIFDGRRKYLPLEAEKHRRFGVPAAASSWAVEGALNHGIEDHLPAFEFSVQNRAQFDTARVFFISGILKRKLRNEPGAKLFPPWTLLVD